MTADWKEGRVGKGSGRERTGADSTRRGGGKKRGERRRSVGGGGVVGRRRQPGSADSARGVAGAGAGCPLTMLLLVLTMRVPVRHDRHLDSAPGHREPHTTLTEGGVATRLTGWGLFAGIEEANESNYTGASDTYTKSFVRGAERRRRMNLTGPWPGVKYRCNATISIIIYSPSVHQ